MKDSDKVFKDINNLTSQKKEQRQTEVQRRDNMNTSVDKQAGNDQTDNRSQRLMKNYYENQLNKVKEEHEI